MFVEHPVVALVEDDSATITVITDLLADEGFQTFHWRQGRGAVELIREQQPSAVILDIRLEHQRAGRDVLDGLRYDPATRDIPVIVCTGDEEFLAENRALLRARRYEIVRKPFKLDALLGKVQSVLGRSPRPGASGYPQQPTARVAASGDGAAIPVAPVIALIDGSPGGVTRLTDRLSSHGYGVAPRRWGNGIYTMIRRERPGMAVIEVEQPDRRMAWMTLNRLQRDPDTRAIPILLCSTDTPFLAAQAGRYLVMGKPLNARHLLALIEKTVGPPPAKAASHRARRRSG